MKQYDLTHDQISQMTKMTFDFLNVESFISKVNINNEEKILKQFYKLDNCLQNKIYTIKYLEKVKNYFDDRYILPEMLATVENTVIGYIMHFIQNVNLETILKDYDISMAKKKQYLKEVGLILDHCKCLRNKYNELSNFYIGDLHVNNFIYNKITKKINICDLDSSKIGNNDPFSSRYLSCSRGIKNLDKKYLRKDNTYMPNENSDIYCYIIMILNFLYDGGVEFMNKDEYYEYLNYLESLKFNKELLDIFYRVYSLDDNVSPLGLIDSIPDNCLPMTNKITYQYKKYGGIRLY